MRASARLWGCGEDAYMIGYCAYETLSALGDREMIHGASVRSGPGAGSIHHVWCGSHAELSLPLRIVTSVDWKSARDLAGLSAV